MTTFRTSISSSLLVLFVLTSCSAQTDSGQPDTAGAQRQSFTRKNKTLVKTQGTTEHQNIHCSLQDKNGNLWFGTTGEGVYRFDGKEFTQFTEKDGLSNNKVWAILEDKPGNIWFGTDDGLSRYDGKTISRVTFTLTRPGGLGPATSQLDKISVWSILQDKNGIIWFGTSQDLYCFDGKSLSRFLDNGNIVNSQSLELKWIQCLYEDPNGKIWMGSGPIAMEGVIQFDGKTVTGSKPNSDGWIRYIVEGKNGQIWFGGRSQGNFIYDGKTFAKYTGKFRIGNPMLVDKAGNVWFNGEEQTSTVKSEDGIWRYDGSTFKNFGSKEGLGKYSVWNMLEDKNGNIWIGTRNCELYRYNGATFEAFSGEGVQQAPAVF